MIHSRSLLVCWLALASTPGMAASATPAIWNLKSATQRMLEVAPERRTFDATVAASQEEAVRMGQWPNPSIELRADNRIKQITGQGGASLSQMTLSQPLPFWRIARQRVEAASSVEAAQASRRARLLGLEQETARVFYALQFAAAKHRLAKERLDITRTYITGTAAASHDRLKRYLTPLERERIAIMAEDARQAELLAERNDQNARIEFRNLLGLGGSDIEIAEPEALAHPPTLIMLEKRLDQLPAVEAARQEAEAADEGIKVAESQRYADPVLQLVRSREVNVAGAVVPVTGIGISVEVPLWNRNRALEDRARAEADASAAHLQAVRRDSHTRIEQAYEQLNRQLDQADSMRRDLIEPSRRMFELTQRSFAAGESNILALVDANNVYFDARARYLELLHECALAAAGLRAAAGMSVLEAQGGRS